MQVRDFKNVPLVWEPSEHSGESVRKFWKYVSKKYKVTLENFWDLHKWSTDNLCEFWEEIWDMASVVCSKSYEKILESDVRLSDSPKWFMGARMNYAENLLKYKDERIALYVSGEERQMKRITYSEVYREACRYGASFRKLGLKKGDCVTCYMSNREEALYAMLGAISIGAVWSGAIPLLGPEAVINRLSQIEPKYLFTIDRFLNDGEDKILLENLKEISKGLPTLQKIVIVPSSLESLNKDISGIRNSCFLHEFLSIGEGSDGNIPDLVYEQLPFDHPIFISFTSGTTGKPKALIHGSGLLLTTARDFWLHNNASREAVWLSISPVGWVTWNMFSTILSLGVGAVLYEGVPYYKSPTSLWDLVDECNISNLFLTPAVLDELEKRNYIPGERNHLSSLHTILSGSSVVKLQNYDFVYKKIKIDIIFGSAYGSTELMGAAMLLDQTVPVHRGEISSPALGVKLHCFNDQGEAVEGDLGELVLANASPSMPLGIFNDKDRIKFKGAYFNKFNDVFVIGDLAYINPITKGIVICGRSDDTLKPKGWRFGSSEIYNVVDPFPEVKESLCVAQFNKNGDERAVLFLKMRNDHLFTEDLVRRIRRAIERELSIGHVPEVILETQDIPRNVNGKKMEIVVKKIINNMDYNAETVSNIECLENFNNIPELQGY